MLSSVEQAFVGRDEKRAPPKTPAWEASLIWAYPRQPRKPKPFHWLKGTRVEKDVGLRMSDDVTSKDPGDRLYMFLGVEEVTNKKTKLF